MLKKININNFLLILLLFIVLVSIAYSVFCFAQNNVPIYEDLFVGLLKKGDLLNQFFKNVYHGRYVSDFITCMLGSVIPKVLGLHPVTFYRTVVPVIKGIFLFILFFQISKYYYRNKNYDLFLPVMILFMYIQFQFIYAFKFQDVELCSFYGFIFPFIFFNLFWYKFIQTDFSNLSKKDLRLFIVYAFFLGISTEFTNIVSFIALLMLLIFQKEIRKKIMPIFISLSIGIGLYYMQLNWAMEIEARGLIWGNLSTLKNGLINCIQPFLVSLTDIMIHQYGIFLLLITIFSVIIYIKEKSFNKLIFPYSLLSGCLFFSFLLIGDPNHVLCENQCWLYHFDIISQYTIFFTIIVLYLFNNIKIKEIYKKLLLIIIMGTALCFSYNKNNDFIINIFKHGLKTSIIMFKEKDNLDNNAALYPYKSRYLLEKINYFNIKNDIDIAVIPESNYVNAYFCSEYIYMDIVYNLPNKSDHYFCSYQEFSDIKSAYQQYLKDGGEEISNKEIERADFQKLLDDAKRTSK